MGKRIYMVERTVPCHHAKSIEEFGSLVHLQQLLHVFSGITKAWHLVLSAQFLFGFEPIVKEILTCLDHFQVLQGNVVRPLGLIVRIYLLELLVKQSGKMIHAIRVFCKLDEPLMTAFGMHIHINGRGGILAYLRAAVLASVC